MARFIDSSNVEVPNMSQNQVQVETNKLAKLINMKGRLTYKHSNSKKVDVA